MGDGAGSTSVAVMADSQLTNVRVLKPFSNFERIYQGQQALTPIAFPGTRDPRAESHMPGFDPNLLAGIPVPEGARVLLWLPVCFSPSPPADAATPFQLYSYRLVWRYQNLAAYVNPGVRKKRAPYHFPRQSPGASDTSGGGPALPRLTIPASWHSVAYQQTEPTAGAAFLNLHAESITPILDITEFTQPLLPDGSEGVIEQGVADPASLAGAVMPIYMPFWTDAEGDELIIFATRTNATSDVDDVWDFTSADEDLAFSNIYGTGNGTHAAFRDIGIYMQTGSTP